ncbi:MAG: outer membrane beta-barrel protein [Chitinophagaceae bacterium]
MKTSIKHLDILKITCAALLPLLLASCESDIMGSLDASHIGYDGISFSSREHSQASISENIGGMVMLGLGGSKSLGTHALNEPNQLSPMMYVGLGNGVGVTEYQTPKPPQKNADEGSFSVKNNLRLFTGLELIGMRSTYDGAKINMTYLHLPVYATYQRLLGPGHAFLAFGPYFAYGLGGKTKDATSEEKTFDKDFGFKPFDAGLGWRLSYRMTAGYSFALEYDLGLSNIDRSKFGDKAKVRGFSFNFGYSLNKIIAAVKH